MRRLSIFMFILSALGISHSTANAGELTPEFLRCEYRVDPLGIDVTEPRLSWIVTSDARNQVQTAYHILVSSSPELLAEVASGKVE